MTKTMAAVHQHQHQQQQQQQQQPMVVVAQPLAAKLRTSSRQQQQQQLDQAQQQKVQKGWLSRWTRKQWSRHWFVLKGGSLTYYRGPAAELCSFLDGVLDLSLIKHIEVAQREEPALQGSPPASSAGQLVQAFGWQQAAPNAANQLQAHFNFTLKMWNGECHVLSAPSAAERQLWLASINAMTSSAGGSTGGSSNEDDDVELAAPKAGAQCDFRASEPYDLRSDDDDDDDDDGGATDDSSASSAGPSSPALSNVAKSGVGVGDAAAAVETQQVKPMEAANKSNHSINMSGGGGNNNNSAKFYTLNSYQNQQRQQQLEVEISLEQLAARLKSAVRRRREEEELARELQRAQSELAAKTACKGYSSRPQGKQQSAASQHQDLEGAHEQALKRRLMCSQSSSMESVGQIAACTPDHEDDGDDHDHDDDRTVGRPKMGAFGQLLNPEKQAERARLASLVADQENGLLAGELPATRPPGDSPRHRESTDSAGDFVMGEEEEEEEETVAAASRLESPQAPADRQPQDTATRRQKKQVRFDLSLSTQRQLSASESSESSLASSSSSTEEEDDDDNDDGAEDESDSDGSSTLSSPLSSAATSEDENETPEGERLQPEAHHKDLIELEAQPDEEPERAATMRGRSLSDERRQELRRQLATRFSQDEDDQSTSELVRNMIARRNKLRSMQEQQHPTSGQLDATATSQRDHLMPDVDAQLVQVAQEDCEMASGEHEPAAPTAEASSSLSSSSSSSSLSPSPLASGTLSTDQLVARLEGAQSSIGQLERRLNDSYESYQRLELSHKRLQNDLTKCDELHRTDVARMQARISELTLELRASEVKLAEAREKLASYEQQLAKSVQPDEQQRHKENLTPTTGNANSKAFNWITETMLAERRRQQEQHQQPKQQRPLHKAECNPMAHKLHSNSNNSNHHHHHHQPLLLMHHFKQMPAAINQQNLSLKLLNQSKQIQRKLSELEMKVDKIHRSASATSVAQPAVGQQRQADGS